MKRSRFVCPAIASLWLAVAVVSAARPQYGGTLRVETRASIRSLDPSTPAADRLEAVFAARLRPLVFETLVQVDPAGGLRPLLAASWESDERSARWRFRLRPGVVLHDGTALEAWQVAAALRTTTNGWTVSTDGDVVVIESSRPQLDVPWALADSRYTVAVRRSASEIVGSGPFRIERVDTARVTLNAHDRYWGGRPFVDTVQIDMARPVRAQLADLEAGGADLIELQAADARRVTARGLRVAATRPIDVLALVFEPHRADASGESVRRLLSGALDRDAIARVLLQGRAEPARELLPSWLSGYPSALVAPATVRSTRAMVMALPVDRRSVTLRVDPSDPEAQAIAERIAVDAREAGFVVTVQAPAGLAPRPDVRLVRATIDPTSPDRALSRLVSEIGVRSVALVTPDPLAAGASLDAVVRFERAVLLGSVVVPVVRMPALYGIGENVDAWDGDAVSPLGAWNFANLWIHPAPPRSRP